VLTAEADGSFSVISPTVDIGTGTHTIEKQMVATEMGVSVDQVRVRVGDTDSVPYDEGIKSLAISVAGYASVDRGGTPVDPRDLLREAGFDT